MINWLVLVSNLCKVLWRVPGSRMIVSGWLLLISLTAVGKEYKLWYGKPAAKWEECLPLGNGRIGAMVYGNPLHETYQLNEETLWSGEPDGGNNPKAQAALPLVRAAIEQGDYVRASQLWKENAQGPYSARYLPLGHLYITHVTDGEATSMKRELDLTTALSTVTYTVNGTRFQRTTFISYPDQVMAVRITADQPQAISIDVNITSDLLSQTKSIAPNIQQIEGRAPYYVASRDYEPDQLKYSNDRGMRFQMGIKVMPKGGSCHTEGDIIAVRKADEVVILLTAATDFQKKDIQLNDCNLPYDQLLSRHLADYQQLFSRVDLSLGSDEKRRDDLPTDERLKAFSRDGQQDNGLLELYYQYGRYLLIASSRAGGLPPNLQGIWNRSIQPPWGSNYTTNINTEMNYWVAEEGNLAECVQPLSDFISRLAVNGAETARTNYGITQGWVAHHNSDVWAKTSPTGGFDWDPKGTPRWTCWPMAGVWLCRHLWEHYAFSQDRDFLAQTAYPLMKGAALFLLQWLQKDKATGYWVTTPSTSPENKFYYTDTDGKKQTGELSKASSMDMELAWDLLTNCIEASTILNADPDLRRQMEEVKKHLRPLRIGSQGQLLEWEQEFEETDVHHRHASHLFALHPGREILPDRDRQLAEACRQTLLLRGDDGTGWAMAWKVNFWARLFDGNHALKMLRKGLNYVETTETNILGGGTYPNLFDAHPPFQIDGNFGGAAGIAEMLVQSHAGYVHLLPALPDDWQEGHISGIRTRGGFVIDMSWKNGKISTLAVTSTAGGVLQLREGSSEKIRKVNTRKGQVLWLKKGK